MTKKWKCLVNKKNKMTLFDVYKKSIKLLENVDADEINVRILLCEINSLKSMSDFYVHKDDEIADFDKFNGYLTRFLAGEPIQYILSKTEFLGYEFYVDNRVLIPRQESEEVVDFALKKIKEVFLDKSIDVIDVCTGSGVMGLTLAKKCNVNSLLLSDISKDAIEVAKINAKRLDVDAKFICADALSGATKNNYHADVLISNPPYIVNKSEVDESVNKYEPHIALYVDDDLSIYKRIFSELEMIKKNELLAIFEIGHDLKDKLSTMINDIFPNCHYEFIKDINNKDRILYIHLK